MKKYAGKYKVVKKGRKWFHLVSISNNWKAELLIDENTKHLKENDIIEGAFEILKDFPRQIRFLPNVNKEDLEDEKNVKEFYRWLDYCKDAIKKGYVYANGISNARIYLQKLKNVNKEPLQKELDSVIQQMKEIQLENQRKSDMEKYQNYIKYVKNHEGYYHNGFAVLEEIIKKWNLPEEYQQEVKALKKEALKRDILLQIQRAKSLERIEEILEFIRKKGYEDAIPKAKLKKAELIIEELERRFERFENSHVYDLKLKKWVDGLMETISDVEDYITEEDMEDILSLMKKFDEIYNDYIKLPKSYTSKMPESIREKLKEAYWARYEPEKSEWYIPIVWYHEALALLQKKFVSMDEVYELAKTKLDQENALSLDEMIELLPRQYNWLKRQYAMVIYPGGETEYIGKRVNFTRSRKNADIAYDERDKQAIQNARFVQFRDGSHKHLVTYLYIHVEDKWYLLIATEDNLWNEIIKQFVLTE